VLRHEPPAYTKDNSTQTQTPMTAECNCRHSQSAAILLPSRSSPGGRAHSFLGSKMRPPGARDPSWLTSQPTTHRVLGGTKPLALRPCGGFCFSGLPRSPSSIVRVDKPLLSCYCPRLFPALPLNVNVCGFSAAGRKTAGIRNPHIGDRGRAGVPRVVARPPKKATL
jgi:hypothetical protein